MGKAGENALKHFFVDSEFGCFPRHDNPPWVLEGYPCSTATATNGQQQVGGATDAITGNNHALVWNGSPDDYFDLGNLLPSTFTSSVAWTIDPAGDVFGTAIDSSGNIHAIEWTPEPSSLSILGLAAFGLLRRRRPAVEDGGGTDQFPVSRRTV